MGNVSATRQGLPTPRGSDEDAGVRSLAQVLAGADLPRDPTWVIALGLRLAHLLGHLHASGAVHGDVRPETVLLRPDPSGRPDPILATLVPATTSDAAHTTDDEPAALPFRSPEQIGWPGTAPDRRSDLYALGATLYRTATGVPPFQDDDPLRLVGLIMTRAPEPARTLAPTVPAMLSEILHRLLEKVPAARYQTAAGLVPDLARVADDPRTEFVPGRQDEAPLPETSRWAGCLDVPAVLASAQAISAQTDPVALHEAVVEQVRSLTGAQIVQLVVADPDLSWYLRPTGTVDVPVDVETAGTAGLLPITAFRIAQTSREALLVADASQDERLDADPFLVRRGPSSVLAVPVLHGVLRAVLLLVHEAGPTLFAPHRLGAVRIIAGQLGVTLANAQAYRSLQAQVADHTAALEAAKEQLERLSGTDELTGVGTRHRFDEEWPAQWERARVGQQSIAVLMVDIDQLGPFNDLLGRPAGDDCLRAVAGALSNSVRGSDAVCRYGDDRFAIILPRAELRQAVGVAQRAHAGVRALRIAHPGEIGQVTVSVGVAAHLPDDDHTAMQLLDAAHAALNEAKHTGRDQVVAMAPGSLDGH